MTPTPRDLANTLMAEQRARLAEDATRAAELTRRLSEAVPRLTPEGCKVWLIGSLAKGTWHRDSDVDIVIAGLPADAHGSLWNALFDALGLAPDLLRIEELDASFRGRVLKEGILLHVS